MGINRYNHRMQGDAWRTIRSSKAMFSRLRLCCFIFLSLSFTVVEASSPGGLKFQGSERPIDQRTSYNVFGDNAVEFNDYFSIDFKLALYPTTEIGYLVRIKNGQSNRIYNLFYDGQGGGLIFRFNEEGKSNLIVANLERANLKNMDWFQMKIAFDLKRDSIHLTIQDQKFSVYNPQLPEIYSPMVLFGRSEHIIDVPSFAIKDLSIGNTEKYIFPLTESKGNAVHDINGEAFGHVSNPEWLVNDAYHWRHKVSFHSESVAGSNYNPAREEIYYFNRDSLRIYNVRSGETSLKIFEGDCPVQLKLGMNFIHNDTLYTYEPNIDDYSGPTVAALNLNNYQWTALSSEQLVSPLHHHGSYFNPHENQFTIFGGFGRMRYSNDFFAFDLKTNSWDTLPKFQGDFLSPRYFSSVGYLKETNSIYVFGGMGNESGEQTVGRKYYYDLHKIDLNTRTIKKLWEIQWERDNMVPVRGMVILNDSSFYTLCYPEHFSESLLKLYQFSMKDGSYEILGDSIPIRSDKITTNANLYYDSSLNYLYAIVQEFEDDISSDLKVYSLSFPPLTAKELATYSGEKNPIALMIIVGSFLLIMGIGYFAYRKRKRKIAEVAAEVRHIEPIPSKEEKQEIPTKPNSIYLFGEFTVNDRANRDITYMFSTQLKQIFCLILQYTTTEGGIASQRLSNILWPDKPADKVKNSRGVTINHLRKVLNELDGIELIYDKGFFKLVTTESFYSDYTRCLEIISGNNVTGQRDELLTILSRGKFLQLFDHPLYDSFKEELEKKLEPVLIVEMEKSFEEELYPITIRLAEAVFNIDPLNDAALTFQIKAMQKLKMNDEARLRYQTFVIEYKKVMGGEYPHPYKDVG